MVVGMGNQIAGGGKITANDGLPIPGFTGTWYRPTQDGRTLCRSRLGEVASSTQLGHPASAVQDD